jgi:hypothetical protein
MYVKYTCRKIASKNAELADQYKKLKNELEMIKTVREKNPK